MRLLRMIIALASVGAFFVLASPALAAPDVSLRGQCGGQVYSWQQYVDNLSTFGAVQQAANVNRYAGYSPRDGSFTQWMKERVIVTRLAAPAVIDNYGCNANGLFKAGKKHLTKGWPVLVALPGKYSKSDVRLKPTRSYKAALVSVRLVGQASCTNPGKAIVKVIIYVKIKTKPTPKAAPKPKPKPKPKPAPKPPAALCITAQGFPLYVLPPGITVVNGVCTSTTTVTTQTCKEGQTVSNDSNGNMICINNSNTNTNTVTVPVTVVVTPPSCGSCAPPPAPVCPPGTTGTYPNCQVPPPPPCVVCVPPPPPPPPAPQPPALVNQVNPEEINANGETYPNICVTVLGKSGNSITMVFGATYGSFAVSTVTITSAGTDRVCTTYKAPNDSSVVGKSEVITYDAVDNTTGLRAQQVRSQPFPIKAPPVRP